MKRACATRETTVDDQHARAMMRLVHHVTAGHPERAALELNVRQRLIIQYLGMHGCRSMAAVAQQLRLTPSTMTGLVDRLEAQGFVRREAHPSDRRATVLRLTRKGEAAFRREVDFYRVLVDETLAALGHEVRPLLLEMLARMSRTPSPTTEAT